MSRVGRRKEDDPSGSVQRASRTLAEFAGKITRWTGSNSGFGFAVAIVLVWAAAGPIFGFSDTWQLVINTGTTIGTFLMVFLIQRSQNKDGLALQLKLNELVAAIEGASNRLIDVEDLTEEDLEQLREHYRKLVDMAKHDDNIASSHSVEEAESRHAYKRERRKARRAS